LTLTLGAQSGSRHTNYNLYRDEQIIRYGLVPDFKPFTFVNDDGYPTGFYIELFTKIIREFGYEPEFVVAPFSELYPKILNNEIDLFSTILRQESRENLFYWPGAATVTGWGQYFIKNGKSITDIMELENSRIGLVKDEAQGQNFIEYMSRLGIPFEPVYFDNFQIMINAVLSEDVSGGVAHNTVLLGYDSIQSTGIIFSPTSGYTTCSITNYRMIPLVDQFTARLTELKSDPDSYYWELYEKWYSSEGFLPTVLPGWLMITTGILVGIILLLVGFSWILNNRVRSATNSLRELNESLEEKVLKRTEQLNHASLLLAEADKTSLTLRLVAGIAHEINTPLGVSVTAVSHLAGEVGRIRKNYQSENLSRDEFENFLKDSDDVLTMTSSNLNRAAVLINNFRNVSSDQAIKEKRQINLEAYITGIYDSVKPEFKNSGHKVHLNLKNCSVTTYPDILVHIILNLIFNSLKHGFRDDIKNGQIYISALEKNGHITLIHTDTGHGISEQVKEHIFEPFFTTNRDAGNTGLGLNIVKNLIYDKLNGSITVSSVPGVYTRFKIDFDTLQD